MMVASLRNWVLAIRVKTLSAILSPIAIGVALSVGNGGPHWISVWFILFSSLLIQIGTNLTNDYFDWKRGADTVERVGPTRVTQAGLIKPSMVKLGFILSFSFAFVMGISLMLRGGWPIVAIGLVGILFGYLYTGGPFPLAYHGLGEVFVFVFFGPVAVAGTYYLQVLSWNWESVFMGIVPGVLGVALLTVNNIRDEKQDRLAEKKTLVVRLGRRFGLIQYALCLGIAIAVPVSIFLHWGYGLLLAFVVPAFFLWGRLDKGAGTQLNSVLAGTSLFLLIYTFFFVICNGIVSGWIKLK